jgi:predicted RNA-binding Zn ribbon-like protein
VVTVTAMPMEDLILLTNEYATVSRIVAHRPSPPPDPTTLALPAAGITELTRVADTLYGVFAAPNQSAVAGALNALLLSKLAVSQLDPDQPAGPARWHVPDADQSLLVSCLAALLVAAHAGHRFGLCQARQCADVYVDSGRGRSRRFCSAPCQNRTKTANFRRRARS